jgi:transcription initiation factor TFIID subunit 2
MDLGTMQTKLSQGKYRTMEAVAADYRLMIDNCRAFNPPQTYPTQCADVLDTTFEKEWAAATEKKLLYGEKRSLQAVLNKLVAEPQYVGVSLSYHVVLMSMCRAWLFLEPVDPVALGIPMYHDIIPKKEARDLRTIRQKLDADKYGSVDALEADLELMINNAIKFNGAESEVGAISIQFRNRIREILTGANLASAKKRKEGGGSGTPQPGAKKIKLV